MLPHILIIITNDNTFVTFSQNNFKQEDEMGNVLLRALALVSVIFLAMYLHHIKFLSDEAGTVTKKILMYITLPCTIITNFSKTSFLDYSMLILIFLGISTNAIMIIIGALITKNKSSCETAIFMNCLPAYNIGAFCLPYIQSFLPTIGSITACMFDAGNSIMCTGGTYAITAEYLSDKNTKFNPLAFLKRIVSSAPLMTYLFMIILSLLRIKIPTEVITFLSPATSANTFIAMFMIGLLFKIEMNRSYLLGIVKIIIIRQVSSIIFALFFYFCLPFDLIIRQTLVIICFAPMSVVAPVFTGLCGGDEGMASAADSISILISIVEITLLLVIMGI